MFSIPTFSPLSTYCVIIFFMGDNSSLWNLNIESPSQATEDLFKDSFNSFLKNKNNNCV